jgi:hypothetical protein
MSTLLGFYSPNEGVSVEEAFQSHIQSHSLTMAKGARGVTIPGLHQYLVGRVTKLDKGTQVFSNYFRMTWDDEALAQKYIQAARENKALPGLDVLNKFKLGHLYLVDETCIFENGPTANTKAVAIRFNVFSPKEGLSPEALYRFHVDDHAPEVMDTIRRVAMPGLKRYVIGRVIDVAMGEPLFTNLVKMWWDDLEAMNRYLAEIWTVKKPPGTTKKGEMGPKVNWLMNSFIDEEVIYEKKCS